MSFTLLFILGYICDSWFWLPASALIRSFSNTLWLRFWQTDQLSIRSSVWPLRYETPPLPTGWSCHLQLWWFLPLFCCVGECWWRDVSGIKYQMLGWGRVECGGLGCTQLRSVGFGFRRSLSELGWDWLALCLCRFGLGWGVDRAGISL